MRMVADACGVHVSTVSRALRRAEADEPVLNDTDARVRRVAAELNYVINPNASSLKTKKSHTLGVLVPSLTDTTLAAIYDAAELTAKARGFETFVVNTHDNPTEQDRRIRLLAGRQVDGLLVGDARADGSNLAELGRAGIPFVLVLRRSDGHPYVTGDDFRGGYLAAQHLIEIGHRRIGVIAGPRWASTSTDRVDGFRDGLADAGVELLPEHVVEAGFEVASGKVGAARLLSRRHPPTAIFAVNDISAIGVLGQLRAHGLRPGSDIGVVGYNDLPMAAELTVPLTTLHNPLDQLGRIAIEKLLDLMAGRPAEPTMLPPRLMVRESTVP
jgi:LacI family transcriptional regulator, galactose operon repressor